MKKIKLYIFLHGLLFLFSVAPVFTKLAGKQVEFNLLFFIYYGASLLILGIYAFGWQQIIKRMPLTTAYANRAVTVIWGMMWGAWIFGENISFLKIIGILVIVGGIILFSTEQNELN